MRAKRRTTHAGGLNGGMHRTGVPLGPSDSTPQALRGVREHSLVSMTCILAAAATSLMGPESLAQMLYWTDGAAIHRVDLDGEFSPETLVNGATGAGGIAVDVAGGRTYWADGMRGSIRSADLSGFNVKDEISTGVASPMAIAVDSHSPTPKLYWTNATGASIDRCGLDDSSREIVVSTTHPPRSLALDAPGGKLYWTQRNGVFRADLNGRNAEMIVSQVSDPRGIALNLVSIPQRVYWTDWGGGDIRRAHLDGSGVEVVLTSLDGPVALTLDVASVDPCGSDDDCAVGGCGDYGSGIPGICDVRQAPVLYWAESGSGRIRRSALDGSGVSDVVSGVGPVGGLALLGIVTFENVNATAFPPGLDLHHGEPANIPERLVGGACAGDFNNDGNVDLYYTRIGVPNLLFENNGAGGFTEVGAAMGVDFVATSSGCAWGDVDGDGWLDLYVQQWCIAAQHCPTPVGNQLFMNQEGMGFVENAAAAGVDLLSSLRSSSGTFGDYDNDGDLDLHVVEWDGQGQCPPQCC